MTYLEREDGKTVVLHGFEHLKDIIYVYVSPIDGKLVFHTHAWDSSHIRIFSITDGRVASAELVQLIEAMNGFGKLVLYNKVDGSYFITPLVIHTTLLS